MTQATQSAPEGAVKAPSVQSEASMALPGSVPSGDSEGLESHTGPNAKEARYRVQRNEAREALAAAEARIAELQRAEVERIAGDKISNASDLLALSGRDLSDFLTEAGGVDSAAVAEAAAELLSSRPGLRKASPAFDPSQGHGGAVPQDKPSFSDLFKD